MAQLDRLIREARKSMRARGHEPKPAIRYTTPGIASIYCAKCNMSVGIITKPLPNEIQIGGEAVARNCSCDVATAKSGRPITEQPLWRFEEPDYAIHAVQGC
jgi:hypothetical protein